MSWPLRDACYVGEAPSGVGEHHLAYEYSFQIQVKIWDLWLDETFVCLYKLNTHVHEICKSSLTCWQDLLSPLAKTPFFTLTLQYRLKYFCDGYFLSWYSGLKNIFPLLLELSLCSSNCLCHIAQYKPYLQSFIVVLRCVHSIIITDNK